MQSENNDKDEKASNEPAKTGTAIENPKVAPVDDRAREKTRL